MSLQAHYQTVFRYHFATTARLMDEAAQLEEAAYRHHPGYGHGSIHELLCHLLRTDNSWRHGLLSGKQQAGLRTEDLGDLTALRAAFAQEAADWQAYLDSLDDGQIAGEMEMFDWRGNPHTFVLWRILQHVILHGMQHHAELAALLTAQGRSPGDIDFLFYQGE